MSGETLVYKSEPKTCSYIEKVLEVSDQNGIECTWTSEFANGNYNLVTFKWALNWNQLKNFDADSLIGTITVTSPNNDFNPCAFDVKLTQPVQTISHCAFCNTSSPQVTFEYSLTPHYTPYQEVSCEDLFGPSEQNDTILVVSGKKLHVNKMFLSFHSEFFRALFSSNYKEGSMDEIPIKDVSYEDFGLLLSTIYPKTVFPNDKTVEKLLELADRFIMSSVIGVVEYHLIYNTEIANEKLMLMADKYGMKELLKKTIREINTAEKAKLLKKSSVCKELSENAKSMLFDRIMHWM
ncbi:hypothetical protein CRE_21341 [Caenorhabditis remanei]|uniref:BTB domain-containing protein n=1 Tax=Caenorhabditis remanei TaxID=31234 RepID=E3MUU5_CAERE|nr:hypothetical protein CRE_21341 [Caenorhabditis remanei]